MIDGAAVRFGCVGLVVFYSISALVRPAPGHPEVWALRGIVVLYGVAGALLGPRFTWSMLRRYTFGLALLLPAVTATVSILRGNPAADLAVTALSIFVPMVFMQTAIDILAAIVVLVLASAAVLSIAPPPGLPVEVVGVVLAGAIGSGALTALVLIAFRGRLGESTAWWQAACARERALREFTELAAPHLGDAVLAREFVARFHGAFGPGLAALVLVDASGTEPRVAATAGQAPSMTATPAELAALLDAVAGRQARVLELDAATMRGGFGSLGWLGAGGTLVLLPIPIDERVEGVVVLSRTAPRPVEAEELLLWRAMANQVGAAVGSARLFSRLQDALRARSEFVNTMSHELRSPLNVIIGYAEMLAEGGQDVDFIGGRIRASALELLQLVENTLAVARLGTGKIRLAPSEFEVGELVDELRESTRALPEARGGVPVRWEVAPELRRVRLDRLKVKEIVHNLISNALKFTAQGTVVVRFGREDGQMRIDVEDTGTGIPPAAQARIFDMFERVESANGARAAGVGLGLYIVKNLVQLMEGSVTLASEPDAGSRFTVWLPL